MQGKLTVKRGNVPETQAESSIDERVIGFFPVDAFI